MLLQGETRYINSTHFKVWVEMLQLRDNTFHSVGKFFEGNVTYKRVSSLEDMFPRTGTCSCYVVVFDIMFPLKYALCLGGAAPFDEDRFVNERTMQNVLTPFLWVLQVLMALDVLLCSACAVFLYRYRNLK